VDTQGGRQTASDHRRCRARGHGAQYLHLEDVVYSSVGDAQARSGAVGGYRQIPRDRAPAAHLEVLETERSMFQSELEASRTLQEHFSAVVALYAALGGGWDPEQGVVLPESRIVLDDE
jgi:hypothetical protein